MHRKVIAITGSILWPPMAVLFKILGMHAQGNRDPSAVLVKPRLLQLHPLGDLILPQIFTDFYGVGRQNIHVKIKVSEG